MGDDQGGDANMRGMLVASLLLATLAGCASQRIVNRSEWFGQENRGTVTREIFANLSKTVYNPNNIPTRTTMSPKIEMTFTDTSGLNAAFPTFNQGRGSGLISASLGDIIDQYKASVESETNADTLRALRNLYREAVYPEEFHLTTEFGRQHHRSWLFWKNRTSNPGPERAPGEGAILIGSTEYHHFYVLDHQGSEAFSDLILETFGQPQHVADARRASVAKAKSRTAPVIRAPAPQNPSLQSGPTILLERRRL
jgi:hypothetical protein